MHVCVICCLLYMYLVVVVGFAFTHCLRLRWTSTMALLFTFAFHTRFAHAFIHPPPTQILKRTILFMII